MPNVLQNLVQSSDFPQDTTNSNSETIDTGGVLPRGMEISSLLEIELSPVDIDAAAADEVNDMSAGGGVMSADPPLVT